MPKESDLSMADGIVAYSELNNPDEAIEEVLKQISIKGNPVVVVFSCPGEYFDVCSVRLSRAFPKAQVIGCTTYMALSSKGNGKNSLVAWALTEGVECAAGLLFEIAHYPMRYASSIERAVQTLSDTDNTICLDFSNAAGNCEELIQDTFKKVLEPLNIPVAGGTAGGKDLEDKTLVSLNGEVYNEACVFVLIRNLTGRIFLHKENIFKPTKMVVTATDVDCEERVVYDFDGASAAETLAYKLGVSDDKLAEILAERPLGRIVGDEIYITDIKGIRDDGGIDCFARIYNQSKLVIMEPDVLEAVWKKTSAALKASEITPSMTFAINCYARIRFFEHHGTFNAYNEMMKSEYGQYAGMVGFGEQVNYEHFNVTMVLVVLE